MLQTSLPDEETSPANKLRVGGEKQKGLETLLKGSLTLSSVQKMAFAKRGAATANDTCHPPSTAHKRHKSKNKVSSPLPPLPFSLLDHPSKLSVFTWKTPWGKWGEGKQMLCSLCVSQLQKRLGPDCSPNLATFRENDYCTEEVDGRETRKWQTRGRVKSPGLISKSI